MRRDYWRLSGRWRLWLEDRRREPEELSDYWAEFTGRLVFKGLGRGARDCELWRLLRCLRLPLSSRSAKPTVSSSAQPSPPSGSRGRATVIAPSAGPWSGSRRSLPPTGESIPLGGSKRRYPPLRKMRPRSLRCGSSATARWCGDRISSSPPAKWASSAATAVASGKETLSTEALRRWWERVLHGSWAEEGAGQGRRASVSWGGWKTRTKGMDPSMEKAGLGDRRGCPLWARDELTLGGSTDRGSSGAGGLKSYPSTGFPIALVLALLVSWLELVPPLFLCSADALGLLGYRLYQSPIIMGGGCYLIQYTKMALFLLLCSLEEWSPS